MITITKVRTKKHLDDLLLKRHNKVATMNEMFGQEFVVNLDESEIRDRERSITTKRLSVLQAEIQLCVDNVQLNSDLTEHWSEQVDVYRTHKKVEKQNRIYDIDINDMNTNHNSFHVTNIN